MQTVAVLLRRLLPVLFREAELFRELMKGSSWLIASRF
jgi:hypothetical protein